jgi:hypothetical protein
VNNANADSMLGAAKRATLGAVAIFLVTTMHHVYGAYLYHTPWRTHAAAVSGIATALIAASLGLLRNHSDDAVGAVAPWAFVVVVFLVPFLGFGVYEGVYNHALKDALYFAHASPGTMTRLFPPPIYEMPNNAFFEVTGVMQVVPGFMTGYYLYGFVRDWQKPRRCDARGATAA